MFLLPRLLPGTPPGLISQQTYGLLSIYKPKVIKDGVNFSYLNKWETYFWSEDRRPFGWVSLKSKNTQKAAYMYLCNNFFSKVPSIILYLSYHSLFSVVHTWPCFLPLKKKKKSKKNPNNPGCGAIGWFVFLPQLWLRTLITYIFRTFPSVTFFLLYFI